MVILVIKVGQRRGWIAEEGVQKASVRAEEQRRAHFRVALPDGRREACSAGRPDACGHADQTVPALRRAGVDAEEWVIPPLDGIRPECVERAALEAFDIRLGLGAGWLPDVLFFTDDYVARGAITALSEYGLRIPDDVRVVTWANRGNGPVMRLPLTRMEMDPIAHGETVARCVVTYLRDGGFPAGVYVGPRYIAGLSFPERAENAERS